MTETEEFLSRMPSDFVMAFAIIGWEIIGWYGRHHEQRMRDLYGDPED